MLFLSLYFKMMTFYSIYAGLAIFRAFSGCFFWLLFLVAFYDSKKVLMPWHKNLIVSND